MNIKGKLKVDLFFVDKTLNNHQSNTFPTNTYRFHLETDLNNTYTHTHMSAKVDTFNARGSDAASLAPSYTTNDYSRDIELSRLGTGDVDHDSLSDVPPGYDESTSFAPAVQLQIQTVGKPVISLPFPPKAEAIPAIPVHPDGTASGQPRYLSVRPNRNSGSCYLVSGDADASPTPLSTTTYRFGPGRPPQVHLFLPGTGAPEAAADAEEGDDLGAWDSFIIESKGMLTRAQRMRSRLGTFEWRYASRSERKAANASSLLILDRVVKVVRARNGSGGSSGKDEEIRTPIARFVRNAETRTPGSKPSSAGNGGRLLMDLTTWDESEKLEREMAAVLIVTTMMSMLKKEVDRRRAQQIAALAGAAGGGG